MMRRTSSLPVLLLLTAVGLGACSTTPPHRADGPPSAAVDFSAVPDAVPRVEPRSRYGNPPAYTVFGQTYHVMDSSQGHVERGIASWYGRKFHGRKTSSGEPYDMLAMTAAHKTLPLPTYVRVTRLDNGRSVVVKVNDRGPFHANRIIDLSYAAAVKLGMQHSGTAPVEIRAIDPRAPEPAVIVAEEDAEPMPALAAGPVSAADTMPVAVAPDATTRLEAAPPSAVPTAIVMAASSAQPSLADIPQPGHHDHKPVVELTDYGTAPEDASHPPAPSAAVYLQLGAFSRRSNAERLQSQLEKLAGPFVIREDNAHQPPIYRLRLGPFDDVETANALAPKLLPQLSRLGVSKPRIVID